MSKFECFGHAVKGQCYPKTFLRIGSYYKTTIDNLKIMNHLELLIMEMELENFDSMEY